jgi:uncharacterized membrane protein (DUF373 family)
MTQSFLEAEIKKIFLSSKVESFIVKIAKRFTYGLSLTLVLSLIGISTGMILVFFKDVWHILQSRNIEHGMIAALGSLLFIWVMIELMETEIKHLEGKAFPIIIFIHVVLVSLIREILIVTLEHNTEKQVLLVGTTLAVGVVYWLVAKSEKKDNEKIEH